LRSTSFENDLSSCFGALDGAGDQGKAADGVGANRLRAKTVRKALFMAKTKAGESGRDCRRRQEIDSPWMLVRHV
jgi:hypothetical protein